MKKSTLFFIPDITGFTKFVKQTEVLHGQHIISELLEILIDSNELDLTLSEIEGDALFFYKQDGVPDKNEVIKQSQTMFTQFHQHLRKYQGLRICECGACRGAGNLTLKIIAHTGPVDFITVKGQKKPYGQDVILAHRLLKNNIASDEYVLMTKDYLGDNSQALEEGNDWIEAVDQVERYDNFEDVQLKSFSLSPLLEDIHVHIAAQNLVDFDTFLRL